MATIALNNMEFYAFHGCYAEEQLVGNYFQVDLTLDVDCSLAAQTDNIEDTVSYLEVYQEVKREMMITSKLLEHVCQRIITALEKKFPAIRQIEICVAKNNPPLGGKIGSSSVTMSSQRL